MIKNDYSLIDFLAITDIKYYIRIPSYFVSHLLFGVKTKTSTTKKLCQNLNHFSIRDVQINFFSIFRPIYP